MRSLRFPAESQVQGGAMQLSLQAVQACTRVVVWLQVHGGYVTCFAVESEERITSKRLFQPIKT